MADDDRRQYLGRDRRPEPRNEEIDRGSTDPTIWRMQQDKTWYPGKPEGNAPAGGNAGPVTILRGGKAPEEVRFSRGGPVRRYCNGGPVARIPHHHKGR